jgi:hypothetical protein
MCVGRNTIILQTTFLLIKLTQVKYSFKQQFLLIKLTLIDSAQKCVFANFLDGVDQDVLLVPHLTHVGEEVNLKKVE